MQGIIGVGDGVGGTTIGVGLMNGVGDGDGVMNGGMTGVGVGDGVMTGVGDGVGVAVGYGKIETAMSRVCAPSETCMVHVAVAVGE